MAMQCDSATLHNGLTVQASGRIRQCSRTTLRKRCYPDIENDSLADPPWPAITINTNWSLNAPLCLFKIIYRPYLFTITISVPT